MSFLVYPTRNWFLPTLLDVYWGIPIEQVKEPKKTGLPWYQLLSIGLTQWSHARCLQHIPRLLKGCASLDGREKVSASDYRLLTMLLSPMTLERYIISTTGFEYGRWFESNVYCMLVELVSHKLCTLDLVCEDYKIAPETVVGLIERMNRWVYIQKGTPRIVKPTEQAEKILNMIGMNEKW